MPASPSTAVTESAHGGALVVSTHFPKDASFVGGVHRRLDVLVEAIAPATEHLTVLFLVRSDVDCSEPQRRLHEEALRARWSAPISLRLAPVRTARRGGGRWQSLVGGAFDFRKTARLDSLDNDDARRVVTSALAAARPRLVLAHRLDAMSVLMRAWPEVGNAKVVMDLDDVEHVATFRRLLRNPQWPAERLQLLHLPALLAGEYRAIRRAHATLVCSQGDKTYLDRRLPGGRVHVVPNATIVSEAPPPPAAAPTVLFVGTFAHPPNVQAADLLVRSVWPAVVARVPEARLVVVGKDPEAVPAFAAAARDPSITFAGFVADLAPLYAATRVVCCPIRVGGGTRVKIVEAAGYARAIVSTPLGAEGLAFEDGREIVLRERVGDLAAACAELLRDPEAAARLGIAAWERARQVYDRAAVLGRLRRLFHEAAGGAPPTPGSETRASRAEG